jgi:hypothetical protein
MTGERDSPVVGPVHPLQPMAEHENGRTLQGVRPGGIQFGLLAGRSGGAAGFDADSGGYVGELFQVLVGLAAGILTEAAGEVGVMGLDGLGGAGDLSDGFGRVTGLDVFNEGFADEVGHAAFLAQGIVLDLAAKLYGAAETDEVFLVLTTLGGVILHFKFGRRDRPRLHGGTFTAGRNGFYADAATAWLREPVARGKAGRAKGAKDAKVEGALAATRENRLQWLRCGYTIRNHERFEDGRRAEQEQGGGDGADVPSADELAVPAAAERAGGGGGPDGERRDPGGGAGAGAAAA